MFIKRTVAAFTVGMLLWLVSRTPVYSQAQTLLFGSYNNSAKAVTVTSAGELNVSVTSGSITVTEANLTLSNVITDNVSTSAHGFAPILDNVVTHFFNGQGGYTTPPVTTDATLTTTDITTNNVSTSKHGFAPKSPNDVTLFLNGLGAYSAPATGGCAGNCSVTNLLFPASPTTSTTGILYRGTATAANRFLHNFWDSNGSTTDSNTFLGMLSGNFTMAYSNANNSAANNVGIGDHTLTACTSCGSNVVIGSGAGLSLTIGFQNVIIGNKAGQFITTGSANVIIGKDADFAAGAADVTSVTAVGIGACRDNTVNDCTAFGDHALGQNTTGPQNLAMGLLALGTNKTGGGDIGIGEESLGGAAGANNGQNYSTAVGFGALRLATTGSGQNVALGYQAGYLQTTDDNVIGIGFRATRTGGTPIANTILIGTNGEAHTASNETAIGNTSITVFKTFGTSISSGGALSVANVGANSCGTSAASVTGNDNVGDILVGATAGTQCRVTFVTAAPTRRVCAANDETTTVAVRVTYVDSTHMDFIGTFTAADHVGFLCGVF